MVCRVLSRADKYHITSHDALSKAVGLAGHESDGATRRLEDISHSGNHVKFISRSPLRKPGAHRRYAACIKPSLFCVATISPYVVPDMHWLDRIAGVLTSRPRFYDPVFADGWGDRVTLLNLQSNTSWAGSIPSIDLSWSPTVSQDNLRLSEGTFVSPAAEILPDSSRIATVLHVEPKGETSAICLILASFNDHGFETRLKLATRLVEHGIASVILENPYYGRRRPVEGQPLRTVVDFYSMGAGAVLEGRSILSSLNDNLPLPIGVAGYSMGGNIAALVSATVPFPVATAGLAASHSPGPVWIEGLLTTSIAWAALGGREVQGELGAVLGSVSALAYDPPPHAARAVLAAPVSDGYIPRHAFEALHAHWPGSELRWIKGGHASVLLWRKDELSRAIVDSFERLWPGCVKD